MDAPLASELRLGESEGRVGLSCERHDGCRHIDIQSCPTLHARLGQSKQTSFVMGTLNDNTAQLPNLRCSLPSLLEHEDLNNAYDCVVGWKAESV